MLNKDKNTNRLIITTFISELIDALKSKAVPIRQHLRVEVPNGFDAPVVLNLPNGFDVNASKKYPLIVYSYGGPGIRLQNSV